MIRRSAFLECAHRLSAVGFKILVDLFASSRPALRFKELPYTFRSRVAGTSKLDGNAAWSFGLLMLDKLIGHIVPVRFVAFALVGGLGVLVHLLVLSIVFHIGGFDFVIGQSAATLTAMVFNFAFNNIVTYRDRRLTGSRWLYGLASFMAACSVGALANVGVASYIFQSGSEWLVAALAGVLVSAVWNYAVTSVYTWGSPGRS